MWRRRSTRCQGSPDRDSSWFSRGKRTITNGSLRYFNARHIISPPSAAVVLAVRCAAARVRVEHDVSLRGHPHELVRVRIAVRRVRAAVDLEDQWVFFGRVEIRRLEDPALNLLSIERGVPDFFRLALPDVFEEILIDVGQLLHGRDASFTAAIAR